MGRTDRYSPLGLHVLDSVARGFMVATWWHAAESAVTAKGAVYAIERAWRAAVAVMGAA